MRRQALVLSDIVEGLSQTGSGDKGGPKNDAGLEVPDLALPAPTTSRKPAPMSSRAPAAPVAPAGPSAPTFGGLDDDDDEMQIERAGYMPTASTGRPSQSRASVSLAGGRTAGGPPPTLELTHERLSMPSSRRVSAEPAAPSTLAKVLAVVIAIGLAGGTAAGLFKLAHRSAGMSITTLLPHAFDATSAAQSGGVAVGSLVVAIALGAIGLKLRPRSWVMVVSSGAMLLTSLAMVTVALVATDEHPAKPDGVLLLPYLLPLAALTLGISLVSRASRRFVSAGASSKIAGGPLAVIGGALSFVAFELSKLAASL